jgi:Flp pilus assembly protein TadD
VTDKQLLLERVNAAMMGWLETLPDDKSSVAHLWSGIALMKEGNLTVAEDFLQKAVRLNPQNDNALAQLAKVLHRRGKKADAVEYINRAWAIRPDRPSTQAIRKAVMGKFKIFSKLG